MKLQHGLGRRKARIEIIPLIDIVFFLLATFVMVSLSMVKNQGIAVRLPSAGSSEQLPRESAVTVSVDKEGVLYLDKAPVSLGDLVSSLRSRKEQFPDLRVFINADAEARFRGVVEVLDETRKLGITRIAIETEKK